MARVRLRERAMRIAGQADDVVLDLWPSSPMADRDVRAVIASLVREADRRWREEEWAMCGPDATVLNCCYDEVLSKPVPRRILEMLAAGGLVRLMLMHNMIDPQEVWR